jgi:hypothetical protein
MDGMHRVLKAVLAGRSHVPAVRFSADPMPDYIGVDPEALPYEEDSRLIASEPEANHCSRQSAREDNSNSK